MHGLVPPRRLGRGRRRGGEMGACAGPPRLVGALCRGRRPGGPPPARVGHGGPGTADTGRGRPCAGRRRSGHRREPVFAPPEPRRGAVVAAAWPAARRCCTTTTCRGNVPSSRTSRRRPTTLRGRTSPLTRSSRTELADHGIVATTIYNSFDPAPSPGDRAGLRGALGIPDATPLLLQPTRALARKNIGAAIALAEATGATYWLLGPAEDGYGPELDRLVAAGALSRSARLPTWRLHRGRRLRGV